MSLCCLSSAIVVDYRADEKGKTLIPSFWTSVILKGAESFGAMCKFIFFGLAVKFGLKLKHL